MGAKSYRPAAAALGYAGRTFPGDPMFGWLDAKAATQFGGELAQYFIEKMPPGAQLNESKHASKTQYVLDKMAVRITAFKREQSLNAFRTAKLANEFKWRLADAGYEPQYIETIVSWLVSKL
jgi:hypothetical protein